MKLTKGHRYLIYDQYGIRPAYLGAGGEGTIISSPYLESTSPPWYSGSYGRRNNETGFLTYDELLRNHLWTKDYTMEWLKKEKLLAKNRICDIRGRSEVKLRECSDRSDGYVWGCRRQIGRKRHRTEKSIREGSWFEQSNLSIEEIIKFTYWWSQGLEQWQIKRQLGLGSHTAVDWDMFCREL